MSRCSYPNVTLVLPQTRQGCRGKGFGVLRRSEWVYAADSAASIRAAGTCDTYDNISKPQVFSGALQFSYVADDLLSSNRLKPGALSVVWQYCSSQCRWSYWSYWSTVLLLRLPR